VTEPLVSADIDLAKLDGFMLDTVRLLGSELWAISSGDEFKAAVGLWCRAWKQRPAASLPDDDRVLASFVNLPVGKWLKVRPMALRGFVKCSDGRFYHPILAEEVKKAWAGRKRYDARREADRQRLEAWRKTRSETTDETGMKRVSTDERNAFGNGGETARTGTGEGTGTTDKEDSSSAEADARFEEFWEAYPSRGDATNPKKPAKLRFRRLVHDGADPQRIITGAKGYAAHCRQTGKHGTETVKQALTFLNQEVWEQYANVLSLSPKRRNPNGCTPEGREAIRRSYEVE
jgi:hypothetical protein